MKILEADIVKHLKGGDQFSTADVYKPLGGKKSKDVRMQLDNLYKQGTIERTKVGHSFYWSSKDNEISKNDVSLNSISSVNDNKDIYHQLIKQLKDEVRFLRGTITDLVKMKQPEIICKNYEKQRDAAFDNPPSNLIFPTETPIIQPATYHAAPPQNLPQPPPQQYSMCPVQPDKNSFLTPKRVTKFTPPNDIPLPLDNRFESLQIEETHGHHQLLEVQPKESNPSPPVQQRSNRFTGPHVNKKPEKDNLPEIISSNNNNNNNGANNIIISTSNNTNTNNSRANKSSSNNNASNNNISNNNNSSNNRNRNFNNSNNDNSRRRKKKVGLLGDSNFNGIKVPEMNYSMRNHEFTKYSYSGATSLHLKHYCDVLLEEQPHAVLLHVGTNDVWGRNRRNVPSEQIAKDIIDIGLKCKSKGVKDIYISSIMITKVEESNRIANQVNGFIKLLCIDNNFSYINNSFITKDDLRDQVHLTDDARYDLVDNYMDILED